MVSLDHQGLDRSVWILDFPFRWHLVNTFGQTALDNLGILVFLGPVWDKRIQQEQYRRPNTDPTILFYLHLQYQKCVPVRPLS